MNKKISFVAAVPQFSVTDLIRTVEYYRDVLGFEIDSYWDGTRASLAPKEAPVFAIVQRCGVQVFFSRSDVSSRTGRTEGAYDLYIRAKGIDLLAEELRGRGADILEGPADRVYGQRELVIQDCNGVVIAFGEEDARHQDA